MAEETLRRNLETAFDPGPDFPHRLLLSRTMATLQAESATAAPRRRLPLPRPAMRWALVAVLLVLAIVAGLLAAGALRHPQTAPAGITPLHIYWANSGAGSGTTIGRARIDGTAVDQRFISGASGPWDVAADSSHIYWANSAKGTIGRANLDGTGVDQSFITGARGPVSVEVDRSHIYWSNGGNACIPSAFVCDGSTIGRANLDGTGVTQTFITGAIAPLHLAVDSNHVYWTNHGGSSVGRANLDGTGVNQTFIQTDGSPGGVAVDGSYIYWTAPNAMGRANIDGTGVNPTFIASGYNAGIEVDSTHIFWSHFDDAVGIVGRANLDGTEVNESFITGANVPTGVAIEQP